MDAVNAEHERNERRMASLREDVDRATSSPLGKSPQSTSSKTESSHHHHNIASALFRRDKPKSKSKSKSKSSKSSSSANLAKEAQELDYLENEINQTRDSEMNLISGMGSGTSPHRTMSPTGEGDDDVLDLADKLLAQLDAKREEDGLETYSGRSSVKSPPPILGGSSVTAEPIPIPGASPSASSTSLAAPSPKPQRTHTPNSQHSQSNHSHHSIGGMIKNALHHSPQPEPPKQNRQQARLAKRREKEEALRSEALAEVDSDKGSGKYDGAEAERLGIEKACKELGLQMVEMPADGHCMYSSIADQMKVRGLASKLDYHDTRKAAAKYMRAHPDDFLPYMPAADEEGGEEGLLSPQQYEKHCQDVESSGAWGSETEMMAISHEYQVPIHVVQGDGSPLVKVGEGEAWADKTPLTVSFHKHQYGLGCHYNSLRPVAR